VRFVRAAVRAWSLFFLGQRGGLDSFAACLIYPAEMTVFFLDVTLTAGVFCFSVSRSAGASSCCLRFLSFFSAGVLSAWDVIIEFCACRSCVSCFDEFVCMYT
jgi:hypothetical protein